MAECFCCPGPTEGTHRLTFEVPGEEAKTIEFCGKCSKRIGNYIRFLRRLLETGEVVQG